MKIGWIRFDIFDCTEEHEKLFRVHGFNNILDSHNPIELISFILEQVELLLTDYIENVECPVELDDNSEA